MYSKAMAMNLALPITGQNANLNNQSIMEKHLENEKHLRFHKVAQELTVKLSKVQAHSLQENSLSVPRTKSSNRSQEMRSTEHICPYPNCYFKCNKLTLHQYHILKHQRTKKSNNDGPKLSHLNSLTNAPVTFNFNPPIPFPSTNQYFKNHAPKKLWFKTDPNVNWILCHYTECDFESKSMLTIQNHLAAVHNEMPFECKVCSRRFRSKGYLKRHSITHLEDGLKSISCPFENCTYKCHLIQHLKSHMRTHTGERRYECSICDWKFSYSNNMRRHMLVTHAVDKEFCKNVFECPTCDYSCRTSFHLKRHIKSHTGDKPFKCTLCSFAAIQRSDLRVHMMKHTGEKPLNCKYCDYTCYRTNALRGHIRRHTGEKPFKCSLCPYRAGVSCTLRAHMKAKHKMV